MGTSNRPPSKAELRRRARALTEQPGPAPRMAEEFERLVADCKPRVIEQDEYERLRPFITETLRRYAPDSPEATRQRLVALIQFASWADRQNLPLETGLVSHRNIEVFYLDALQRVSKRSADNYRSKLKGIANKVNPGPATRVPALPGVHRKVKPPYDAATEAAIVRIARTQPTRSLRRQVAICVALGLGAGIDSAALKRLRRRDVVVHDDGAVQVDVPGPRARTVWVRRDLEELAASGLGGLKPGDLLIGTVENRRNVTGPIYTRAAGLGRNAPELSQARMRTTWLVHLLRARLPLPVIMDAAGLTSARTLTELIQYVEVDGTAETREVR